MLLRLLIVTLFSSSSVVFASPTLHDDTQISSRGFQHVLPGHWHGWPSIAQFFTFGDSYTSNGFNPAGPQPNATNPDGRSSLLSASSDGSNWAEYLTDNYNQSYIRLYDLAQGGAAVNKSLTPELYAVTEDFDNQITYGFMPVYGPGKSVKWNADSSLFSTFFGINDISTCFHCVLLACLTDFD